MVNELEVQKLSDRVVIRNKSTHQVFVCLERGKSPQVNNPQFSSNDEFDQYQLLLDEAFRIYHKEFNEEKMR